MAPIFEDEARFTTGRTAVLIHEPKVYPSEITLEKFIDVRGKASFKMMGKTVRCSNEVRNLPQTARECFYEWEAKLRFDPIAVSHLTQAANKYINHFFDT